MNLGLFQFILLLFSFNCYSQESFNIYLTKHNLKANIDTITRDEFLKWGPRVSYIETFVNDKIDSIFNGVMLRYPSAIRDSSKYLVLRAKDKTKYLWKDTSSADPSQWITYTKVDYKNGYLIFYQSYFQGEEYILFNPKNKTIRSMKGYPVFADSNWVYTVGNYNGEYYFQYKSLVKDSYLQILCDSWVINKHCFINGKFYLEYGNGEKRKYLKVSFPK